MSFTEQNNKYFLGSYPQKTESLTKVSVIIIVGGIMKYDYARKEHLKKITPDTIKQKAIVIWADMSVGTLSDAVNFSLEMSKKSGLEVTDNKLLLYSGASETRLSQLKQANISYIGLMDPSPGINAAPVILNSISSHEKKIRMIYRVDNWDKKFHNNFPPLAQKIKNGGGKADTVSYLHHEIPAKFLQDFTSELVSPSSQQSKQQNNAATKPTTATKTSPNQAANNPSNPNNSKSQQPEAPVNSGVVDIGSLRKFEKMAISDDDDMFIPTMDKTSTLGGLLKNLSEKEHREDYLRDKHIFEGIICRVPSTYSENDYKTEDMLTSYETSERQYIYKVRVPEIDSAFLERPKTFDETEHDRAVINSLSDFRAPSDLIIRVGDRVKVTYGDLRRYKEGKILSRIPENIQDRIPLQAQATSEASPVDGAFNGERAPVTVSAAGEVSLPGATWTIGKRYDGSIMAKPIGVHKGQTQYLESKAADRYLQMKDEAAKEGINLHVNSGFRDFNQQKALRDRFLNGGQRYPANDPNSSPPAGHRAGNAADIQVGSFTSKEYIWLFKNAPKYDWYNSGRFVTTPEPHHHQFAPPGSAAISMGQVSRAIPYHKGGVPYTGERAAADNTTPAKKAESNP